MGLSRKLKKGLGLGLGLFLIDEAFFAPARRQARAQRDEADFRREESEVAAARQEGERQQSIRQQVRKERIRRAQVTSSAEASGVSGSSIETSTVGSGQTIAAAGQAFASGSSIAAGVQTNLLQSAEDARQRGVKAQATGQMWKSAFDLGMTAVTAGAGGV